MKWLIIVGIIFFSGFIGGSFFNFLELYPSINELDKEEPRSVVDVVKEQGSCVVGIESSYGKRKVRATGVIIHRKGYVVTNAHAVSKASEISVSLYDGVQRKAYRFYEDQNLDLAVLKLQGGNALPYKVATFGNSDLVEVGETAIVIGNPFGDQLIGTVTVGVISAKNRQLEIDGKRMDLLQTDAAINSGNSGGPLLNGKGEVVGLITFHVSTERAAGIGFAIPSNEIIRMINGISIQP